MDTDSFIIHIKTEYFYEDFANDIEKWFDTSNYNKDDKRPLPISKNKKVIGLFKVELGRKIVKEFAGHMQKHMHTKWIMIVKRIKLKKKRNM